MDFTDYIIKQNQLTGRLDAYIEIKRVTTNSKLIDLLNDKIKGAFLEKEIIKLEYDNDVKRSGVDELEKILEEHR